MKYLEFVKSGVKRNFTNRVILIIWLLTKPIAILVYIAVWSTVYNYSGLDTLGSFNLQQMINYHIFIIIFFSLIWAEADSFLKNKIQSGDLTTDLLKPYNYSLRELFVVMGLHVIDLFIQVIPAVLISVIFFGFGQSNIIYIIVSMISLSLAFLINYWFSFTWGLMSFYTKGAEGGGLSWLKGTIITFAAGLMVPLTLFPEAIRNVFYYLPFQYIMFVPARIFIGGYNYSELPMLLLMQVLWITAFYFIAQFGFKKLSKTYTGAGE